MKRITITLPEECYDYVRGVSLKEGRSISNQITQFIKNNQEARSCQKETGGATDQK